MKYKTKEVQKLLPTITRLIEYENIHINQSISFTIIHNQILYHSCFYAIGLIILFIYLVIAKIQNLDVSFIQNTYLSFILFIFISLMINIVISKIYDHKRKTIINSFNQQKQNNIEIELNYDDYCFVATEIWNDIKQLYSKYVHHDDITALKILIDIEEMINVQLKSQSYPFTSIKPIFALVDDSFKSIQNNIRITIFREQED